MLMAPTTGAWMLADLNRLPDDGKQVRTHGWGTVRDADAIPRARGAGVRASQHHRAVGECSTAGKGVYSERGHSHLGVGKQRTIRISKSEADDVVADTEMTWHPTGASVALVIDVNEYVRAALGGRDNFTSHRQVHPALAEWQARATWDQSDQPHDAARAHRAQ